MTTLQTTDYVLLPRTIRGVEELDAEGGGCSDGE
jgi:hypothetical protein